MTNSQAIAVERDLRDGLAGRVVTPTDQDYDAMRTVFPGGVDRRPSLIVRPSNAADVQRAVRCVRDAGVPLAIRSGGHTMHSTLDAGVVIDVRDLTALDVDGATRTVWAGTGLTAGAYSQGVGAHGLVTGFGDTGSVGIGGITLGGGIGYLTRKYGLTIDSLVAAEVVTADGEIRHVDAHTHPDLFWAIRGGGGNFGVATRFQYQLHPLQQVVGGMLILPATAAAIEAFVAEAAAAPEELTAIINVMPAPPMPFLAPEHHGSLIIMALMCYAGEADAGAKCLSRFRAIAPPLADLLKPMAYHEMFPPEDASYHPTAVGRTMFADRIDRRAAEAIMEQLAASDAPLRVTQIRALGGAMARVDRDATAFAHRDKNLLLNVAAFFTGPDDRPVKQAWVDDLAGRLDQGVSGAYVNFLNNEPHRIGEAFPGATGERLRAIKAKYDPSNTFRSNENIAP